MTAYLVKITDRLMETEAQKLVPKYSIFYSQSLADQYRTSLLSDPIKFHSSQIKVLKVEVKIIDEVEYN